MFPQQWPWPRLQVSFRHPAVTTRCHTLHIANHGLKYALTNKHWMHARKQTDPCMHSPSRHTNKQTHKPPIWSLFLQCRSVCEHPKHDMEREGGGEGGRVHLLCNHVCCIWEEPCLCVCVCVCLCVFSVSTPTPGAINSRELRMTPRSRSRVSLI